MPEHWNFLQEGLAMSLRSWQRQELSPFPHVALGTGLQASSFPPRVNKQLCSASPNDKIAAGVYTATN